MADMMQDGLIRLPRFGMPPATVDGVIAPPRGVPVATPTITFADVISESPMAQAVKARVAQGLQNLDATKAFNAATQDVAQRARAGDTAGALGVATRGAFKVWGGVGNDINKALSPFPAAPSGLSKESVSRFLTAAMGAPDGTPIFKPTAKVPVKVADDTKPPAGTVKASTGPTAAESAFAAFVKANGGKAPSVGLMMDLAKLRPTSKNAPPIKEVVGNMVLKQMDARATRFMAGNPNAEQIDKFRSATLRDLMTMYGIDPLADIAAGTEEE